MAGRLHLWTVATVCLASAAVALPVRTHAAEQFDDWSDDEDDVRDRFSLQPSKKMPVRLVERPITLTRRTFGLIFDLDITELQPGVPILNFRGGSGYGITDDLEIGIILLSISFSSDPNSGLATPRVFLRHRWLDGPIVELGAVVESELPLSGTIQVSAQLPLRVHLGSVASVDLAIAAGGNLGAEFNPVVGGQLGATVQVIDRLAVSGMADLGITDLARKRVLASVGGQIGYTIPKERGAFAEIALRVTTPRRSLAGGLPDLPSFGSAWIATIVTRWFVFDTPDDGRLDFR